MVVRVTERERATILAALRRGLAIPQQEKHIPLPQAEGSISRSMTARFNDSANGSAKQQGEATQLLRRHSNNGAGMQKDPKTAG